MIGSRPHIYINVIRNMLYGNFIAKYYRRTNDKMFKLMDF